nr:MAG: hypothetical protein EDM05_31990 [Leptolyngbya sp. IPPAS B-1204]
MFEQKTFARQQNSFLNGQLDANRYASVFDSASLESALTSSRSTDLRSEKSASYQEIPVAESFNQASLMDAGIATASPSSMDFTQALNTTWNPETSSVSNQSATWGSGTIWGTDSDFSGMRPAGLSLKNAWSSVKDKAKNADWKKIGHGALDVVGALPIPVVSTAADLVNAGWYAAEGDYKNAAMSAIGAAPGVGDGAKLALKAADAAKTARSARTTTRLTTRTANTPPRPGLAPSPRRETPGLAPTPKPAARRPETPTAAPRREPSGRPDSNPVGAPARRSARRPDPTPSGAVNKPDPRRPDPKPSPTTPKKSEPSRPEGNPTPPGTREQPPRPDTKPETVGTSPSQRPETPASGRDPHLQEPPGSVRPTRLERFTGAMDRAENLSQRLDQINGHVDLIQQMQGGNAETGEPSAADFAFAGLDALVGMRSGRGGTSLSRLVHSEGSTQPATRVTGGGGPQSVIRHADQSQSSDQFTHALASVGGRSDVDLPRASAGSGGRSDRASRLDPPSSSEPASSAPSTGSSGGSGNDRVPPRTGGSGRGNSDDEPLGRTPEETAAIEDLVSRDPRFRDVTPEQWQNPRVRRALREEIMARDTPSQRTPEQEVVAEAFPRASRDSVLGERGMRDTTPQNTDRLRRQPGTATGGETLPDVTGRWFQDEQGRLARVPGQIARDMQGMHFDNFGQFREAFWRRVAADPNLSAGWRPDNLKNMRQGRAPGAPSAERTGGGGNAVYQLDHLTPIELGGGVYDLDNIQVVAPRTHVELGRTPSASGNSRNDGTDPDIRKNPDDDSWEIDGSSEF